MSVWTGGHPSTMKGVTGFPGEAGECSSAGETGDAEGASVESRTWERFLPVIYADSHLDS